MLKGPDGKYVFGTAKVGEKGQIVIPKEARKLFGIEAGDTLLILGDEKHGIIVSKPDVIETVAAEILSSLQREDTE